MKFYDEMKPLYLETDPSGVELGASLLHTREGMSCSRDVALDSNVLRPITFTHKSLSAVEGRNRNIERETLAILHGLETFHHYCFVREISIMTDHKPPVAIFTKDVATLSQRLQHILLRIHQHKVRILYKPGSDLFRADKTKPQRKKKMMKYQA